MKILAINGSHHGTSGHLNTLLGFIGEGIREEGGEFKVVTLSTLKIERCLACGACHRDNNPLRCVLSKKDDVASVFTKMAAADLLIFATPVHVFGISSLLKTFLDRIYSTSDIHHFRVTRSGLFFHDVNEPVCSKPFVSLVCCDNLDAQMPVNARDYFRQYARFMDAPLAGELVRNAGELIGRSNDPAQLIRFPKIDLVLSAYRQCGRELVLQGRISKVTQRHANQEIIPVPLFHLLKRNAAFKKVMVLKAQELFASTQPAVEN